MTGAIAPGRKVLITGGSSGVGAALAALLSRKGYMVVIVGRDRERLHRVAEENPGITPIEADLSRPDAVDGLINQIGLEHPDLSILVNNAAIQNKLDVGPDGQNAPVAVHASRDEIAVNISAPVALSLGLLPLLAQNGPSAVLNITSALALVPKPSAPVYCASKAALHTFTMALRGQCEQRQLPVAIYEAVLPLVDTAMTVGRGKNKISPENAASALLDVLQGSKPEVWIGQTALLRRLHRLAPSVAYRLMRSA